MSKLQSVTNIEVIKTNGGTINLAFGFVTICGFLKIRFNVVKGKTANVFVSWPQQMYEKDGVKKWTDQVSFVNDEDRLELSKEIIKEFNKVIGNVKIVEEPPKKQFIQVEDPNEDQDTNFNYGDNTQEEEPPFEPDPPKKADSKKSKGLSFRRG